MEKEEQQSITDSSPKKETPELTLEEKISNLLGGSIPHLEAIIHSSKPKDKYIVSNLTYHKQPIKNKLLDEVAYLSKTLAITQLYLEEKDIHLPEKEKMAKYLAMELEVTPQEIKEGPNRYVVNYMIGILNDVILSQAFKQWPMLTASGNNHTLFKKMITTWRKIEVFIRRFKQSAVADKRDITFQPPDSKDWKEFEKVVSYIQCMSKDEAEKKFEELNNFLLMVQAAHGKTSKVTLNLQKMSKKEIETVLTPSFDDYEEYMKKQKREGYKKIWKKNEAPKLTSKLWKNIFSYMVNQEQAITDLELFIAFSNKDCIKELWNYSETYVAKATRRFTLEKIGFRSNFYLHTDMLKDSIKNFKDYPHVFHTIQSKWGFLGNDKIKLTDDEFIPHDLFWDNLNEDRIGVTVLSNIKLELKELFGDYSESRGLGGLSRFVKNGKMSKDQADEEINRAEESQARGSKVEEQMKEYPIYPNLNVQIESNTQFLIQDEQQKIEKKKSKKKESKIMWMFKKMFTIKDIFGKGKQSDSEEDSDSVDSVENYIEFGENIDDEEAADKDSEHPQVGSKRDDSEEEKTGDEITHKSTEKDEIETLDINFEEVIHSVKSSNLNASSIDHTIKRSGDNLSDSGVNTKENTLNTLDDEEEVAEFDKEQILLDAKKDDAKKTKQREEDPLTKTPSISEKTRSRGGTSKKNNYDKTPHDKKKGTSEKVDPKEYFKTIAIHIHGGGFIAMSSNYHEFYLRSFCNKLQIPFFAIDYRLAPLAKYPENLHDCIRAYFWILEFCEKVIGTEVENIIFFGDSAGGALVTSLSIWLIENKQRVPDLLLLCYPSLGLDYEAFNKSFVMSMHDYVMHYSSLKAVFDLYLPKGVKHNEDYYINHHRAPESVFRKLPKTMIYTCLEDPLRDDQLRFGRNMQKAGGDITMFMFKHLEHGILGFNENTFFGARIFKNEVLKGFNMFLDECARKKKEEEEARRLAEVSEGGEEEQEDDKEEEQGGDLVDDKDDNEGSGGLAEEEKEDEALIAEKEVSSEIIQEKLDDVTVETTQDVDKNNAEGHPAEA